MNDNLPPIDDAVGRAVDDAVRSQGRTTLCVVDEAEMRAIGFRPPGRNGGAVEFPQSLAPMDDPVIIAAGERLVARGLATSTPTSRSVVTAAGALLVWLTATVHGGYREMVGVNVQDEPSSGVLARGLTIDRALSADTGVAVVQYLDVPVDAGADPLPVRLDMVRLDVLADEIVADAFDSQPAGKRTLQVRELRGGKPVHPEPETLQIDAEDTLLVAYGRGLLGTSLKARRTDRDDFHAHLLKLLIKGK